MITTLIELAQKLINERGSAQILGERLTLIKEQAGALEEKLANLEKENTELKERVAELDGELKAKVIPADFVEHRGALFKRKSGGGYDIAVYCPTCKLAMSSPGGLASFKCAKCGQRLNFAGNQLNDILKELPT